MAELSVKAESSIAIGTDGTTTVVVPVGKSVITGVGVFAEPGAVVAVARLKRHV
jgi:hypothetical protein